MNAKLRQVGSNRWETAEGNFIWKDDFGHFQVKVNGTFEITDTFDKAVAIINSDRY